MKRYALLLLAYLLSASPGIAQDDQAPPEDLARDLNTYLEQQGITFEAMPGVTVTTDPSLGQGAEGMIWSGTISPEDVPDYTIVAVDPTNKVIDVFGPETPHQVEDDQVRIPGYTPPEGTKLELSGGNVWLEAMSGVLTGKPIFASAAPPTEDMFQPLVGLSEVVQGATVYLADRFCSNQGRPSSISLYVSAEFKFIIGGESGTEVTWEFDEVCARPPVPANGQP